MNRPVLFQYGTITSTEDVIVPVPISTISNSFQMLDTILSSTNTIAMATTSSPTPAPSPSPSTLADSVSSDCVKHQRGSSTLGERKACTCVLPRCQKTLRDAVRSGDSATLHQLLEACNDELNINGYDADGQTLLHESVQVGNLELVKVLVRFGADVRLANRDGWSALHMAAVYGRSNVILYLLTATSLSTERNRKI